MSRPRPTPKFGSAYTSEEWQLWYALYTALGGKHQSKPGVLQTSSYKLLLVYLYIARLVFVGLNLTRSSTFDQRT
jgi:hypothetical protein